MKLVVTDTAGAEHELNAVILGLAGDIHILNDRLKKVEQELGLVDVIDEEAETDDAAKSE